MSLFLAHIALDIGKHHLLTYKMGQTSHSGTNRNIRMEVRTEMRIAHPKRTQNTELRISHLILVGFL
jgi:KaiC/GvpD/RAD55 family RecA-like ATPase